MIDEMKLHLENMGPINEANIEISKITIVGGYNATGKSTLSKVLYSFLRSNSDNREIIAYQSIENLIKNTSRYIQRYLYRIQHDNEIDEKIFKTIKHAKNFEKLLKEYDILKNIIYTSDIPDDGFNDINTKFKQIDELIHIVEENKNPLFVLLMRTLLKSEFSTNKFNSFIDISNCSNENPFNFKIDLKNHDINSDDAFECSGGFMLNEVYYIDSISILDLFESNKLSKDKSIDHIDFLKKNIIDDSLEVFDNKIHKNIISLENEIENVINGKFNYDNGEFSYISNDNSYIMHNTASGIKQIGIIQLLLANRALKEDCFLIIDEPEVNLHPEWQIKLAEILILISKKLNVSIYINTHSPLFIEAINTFVYYYDLEDKTKYYLAENHKNLFNINEIKEEDLSIIYDNLGKPFLTMDTIRLEKDLE